MCARWTGSVVQAYRRAGIGSPVTHADLTHRESEVFGLLYHERIGWNTIYRDLVLILFAVILTVAGGGMLGVPDLIDHRADASQLAGALIPLSFVALSAYIARRANSVTAQQTDH